MNILKHAAAAEPAVLAMGCPASAQEVVGEVGGVSIPKVTVNFGMEPYPRTPTQSLVLKRDGLRRSG